MGAKEEREAFKQSVLKMAKYRLRRVLNEAGCTPQEVREAEVEGEDKMIEIIMTKYDEGAINFPGLEKATGKSAGGGQTKRTAERSKKEPEPADDDDPYGDAFGDDDNSEEETPPEDNQGVENNEVEEPKRRGKRKIEKSASDVDLSALEEKLDKIMDLLVSTVETTVELSEKVDSLMESHTEGKEIMQLAFSRIWKLGAASPLKPGFGDIITKARELVAKRQQSSDE